MTEYLMKLPCIRKRLVGLERENQTLKLKLQEKQEHINKTNAFWKKKLYGNKS